MFNLMFNQIFSSLQEQGQIQQHDAFSSQADISKFLNAMLYVIRCSDFFLQRKW